jgi:hypothetical protein
VGKKIAVLVVMAAAGLAQAQTTTTAPAPPFRGADTWSVQSGKTVGTDQTVFWGTVGFPGLFLQLDHGIDAVTDIGGRFGLDYGDAGIVNGCCNVGLDFQFDLRRNFFDNGKIRIAGTFDPGFGLFFPPGATQFILAFPIGVQFGFPVSPVLQLSASFDLAMRVGFSTGFYPGYFALPILFGGGLEYSIQRNLMLTFTMKIGPTIFTNTGATAQFTLYALVGVAYKF